MFLRISIPRQTLEVVGEAGEILHRFPVSTAARGAGEHPGSQCTPRGWHQVRAKIGAGLPSHSVLVGRRPTGECYSPALAEQHPGRDWILSRVLWLSGLEPGKNRMGERDTMRRYIYIHGTADEAGLGQPRSHGCIRMANRDVMALFDLVSPHTRVEIRDQD